MKSMMKRFSRRRRGAADSGKTAMAPTEWLPKLKEQGLVEAASLEVWTDPGIPDSVASIARGERADGSQILVAYSSRSASEAILGGLSAAQFAVAKSAFNGLLYVISPQWTAGARRLLCLVGRTPYAVEAIVAPLLANGRILIDAEPAAGVLATNATQLAACMPTVETRTAFSRAAVALEGLAAKHAGAVRVGTDRLELVVLARRVAEIRTDGETAVLETQIGGRSTAAISSAELAGALDGLEGQLRRRLNDRKVREGEEGLRGRVIARLAEGTELRGLRAWPVPGEDLAVVDGVGVNAEGDPVVVAVREEIEWTTLVAALERLDLLAALFPVLFAELAAPLRMGTPRLLLVGERFADGLERVLQALTIAYELRRVSAAVGAAVDLVSSVSGDGAQSRTPRRGRRRGGRGRSDGPLDGDPAESDHRDTPPRGPAADLAERSTERSPELKLGPRRGMEGDAETKASEASDGDDEGRGPGRRRRRSRRGRGANGDAPEADNSVRRGREHEEARSGEASRPSRPRFEEVSLMDLDDAPGARGDRGASKEDADDSDQSRRSPRRGRRGGRGDTRRAGSTRSAPGEDDAARDGATDSSTPGASGEDKDGPRRRTGANAPAAAPVGISEEDLVDADDLFEILARLTDEEPEFLATEPVEESFDDEEEIDEDDAQSQRRQSRDTRRLSRKDEDDEPARNPSRGRAAILVRGDRDSLLSAILLARDIRQLEGMWIYPQEELMTFFRSIATDLRDDTPIFVVGFTPSPARDVIQASSLYRGRLSWFDRHAWPPEDLVALRGSLGADAVHGGDGIDSTLPLVLETCTRRSRFSDKLVDLATGRFTQHDFERWGRLWRWRAGEIAAKTGDIRADIAALLVGRPSDLAKEAALIALPPAPSEVAWVAANDFRLVHFGAHVMVVLEVDPAMDTQLCARIARERYEATLSLAHRVGEQTFMFAGDEISGRRTLDYMAVAEHLVNKLEWVEGRPDADHVARFHVRDLDRHPGRLDEVIGEIAMGRSLLER